MKHLVKIGVFILLITLFSCKKTDKENKLVFDRIEYVYNLKYLIDKNTWTDFSNPKYDVPLIYYTDSTCYVTNPTKKFIDLFNPQLVSKNDKLSIYKTSLIDSIPFHMEVNISLGDSTLDYDYKSPFMSCSSLELTDKFVPDVHSTEMWASMVMHEYFHGFQFKHPQFLDFYEKNISVSADTLKRLYKRHNWFKESIDNENSLLLEALSLSSDTEIQAVIVQFFNLRDKRLKQTRELLNSDIQIIEETYETMEGTARYIEYSLYKIFATLQPDESLKKTDSLFHSYVCILIIRCIL